MNSPTQTYMFAPFFFLITGRSGSCASPVPSPGHHGGTPFSYKNSATSKVALRFGAVSRVAKAARQH